MSTTSEYIKQQEQIEIARSAKEASLVRNSIKPYPNSHFARYLNTLETTCFPLEYAYYLLGNVKGKTVVDLGCGSGENSVLLASRGAKVLAIDISESLIELAKQRLQVNGIKEQVDFYCASAYELPFDDESIDVVFGIAILHHLELAPIAKEVKRVLRKGGRGIFQEPVRNSRMIKFLRNLIPYQAPDISPCERPLTDRELVEFSDGFSYYHLKAFSLPFINLAQVLHTPKNILFSLYHFDGMLLKYLSPLNFYASIRTFELIK